ncbi:outer membrane efflux protein [Fibrella aestuarina BUZ 2]|uniref:Outer membrane efflux protein n=1 Tax=Fibrella aestuarina BUZ 2 TaxID=1166018 RepID=I0KEH3_9BACT|nr:TolC family protein [Fibrella aestuarina]CCH02526.1 outer membrane efflux protein [Fibrella aestuarina BUZ 2]
MRFIAAFLFLLPSTYLIAQQKPAPAPAQTPVQRALRNAYIVQQGEQLLLQDAIATALGRNYQIKGLQTQEQIARNERIPANAGFYPLITGNVSTNGSRQSVNQTFVDNIRPPQVLNGISNRTTQAGVNLNWTVFNGLANFATYERLGELVRLSQENTRASVEQTIASVVTAYYNVVQQLQQLLAFRQALDISRDRLELARANYEVGTRSKVDFLTAQVDYNADSVTLLTQEQNVQQAKIQLNTLLVRDPFTPFAIRDTIIVRPDLNVDQLRQSMLTNSPLLAAAVLNQKVADINIRLARAQRQPTVNLQTGYNFTFINNEGGFGVADARNRGLTYAVTAAVPIFNGGNIRRLEANARASALAAEYQRADQEVALQQAIAQSFAQYQNSLALLNVEQQNYKIALENIDIAYDRYRVGNSTAVEFRDVQRNAIAAQARLFNAEFNAKAAEVELLRLSSTISQQFLPAGTQAAK